MWHVKNQATLFHHHSPTATWWKSAMLGPLWDMTTREGLTAGHCSLKYSVLRGLWKYLAQYISMCYNSCSSDVNEVPGRNPASCRWTEIKKIKTIRRTGSKMWLHRGNLWPERRTILRKWYSVNSSCSLQKWWLWLSSECTGGLNCCRTVTQCCFYFVGYSGCFERSVFSLLAMHLRNSRMLIYLSGKLGTNWLSGSLVPETFGTSVIFIVNHINKYDATKWMERINATRINWLFLPVLKCFPP